MSHCATCGDPWATHGTTCRTAQLTSVLYGEPVKARCGRRHCPSCAALRAERLNNLVLAAGLNGPPSEWPTRKRVEELTAERDALAERVKTLEAVIPDAKRLAQLLDAAEKEVAESNEAIRLQREEIARLSDGSSLKEAWEEADRARASEDALRWDLNEYGQHHTFCYESIAYRLGDDQEPCSCGFDEAKARAKEEK